MLGLLALLLVAGPALALPQGAQLAAGGAAVSLAGPRQMQISQSTPKAVLNWNGFSIAAGERVDIRQPDAQSVLLNRVTGAGQSAIDGSLFANGRVFLLNPNGILFGRNAQVSVGGLVASTLQMDDADFLAGRYRFSAGAPGARVDNLGAIAADERGFVFLLGGGVANDGSIAARLGTVALAAGEKVTLDFQGDGLSRLRIDKAAFDAAVANRGMLAADGGQVLLSAHAAQALADTVLSQTGVVRAKSLVERKGRILLDGGALGTTLVSGRLDASGAQPGLAGGAIDVLGQRIGLIDGAAIDASGEAGGGIVHVGGGRQGGDASLPNADAVYAAPDAAIRADATGAGQGGSVVVWSNRATRYHGAISATGGARGGDGDDIETSGGHLDVAGIRIDASAARGKAGSWLLDPYDIVIDDSRGGAQNVGSGPDFTSFAAPALLPATVVSDLLSNGTSVSIRAANGGLDTGAGDIQVNASITKTGGADASLTLHAYRDVRFNGVSDGRLSITATGSGRLNLDVNSNSQNSGSGAIVLESTSIASNGGAIRFYGGSNPDSGGASGIRLNDSSIDATSTTGGPGGGITMRSVGGSVFDFQLQADRALGFEILGGSSLKAGLGGIRLSGVGAAPLPIPLARAVQVATPTAESAGILLNGATLQADGPIVITGVSAHGTGVAVTGGEIRSASGVDVMGRSTLVNDAAGSAGVWLIDAALKLDGGGKLAISGQTDMPDTPGVFLAGATTIDGGAGDIVLRALNAPDANGLRRGMLIVDPIVAIRGTGTLNLLPGGVSDRGEASEARDVDINLFTDDLAMVNNQLSTVGPGGYTLNAALLTQNIGPDFANVVIGSAGHSGKITAYGGAPFNGRYNVTLQNGAYDSAGIELVDGLSNPGRQLTLSSGGAVTQGNQAGIDVDALLLHGANARASFLLDNPANRIRRFAARFEGPREASNAVNGDVNLRSASEVTVQPLAGVGYADADGSRQSIAAAQTVVAHDLLLHAQGNIELQHEIRTLGSDITLATGGVFINNGNAAITPGGNGAWRIFADTWEGEARGGLVGTRPLPNIYGCAYGDACAAKLPPGNHFVYRQQPGAAIAPDAASLTRVYGDAAAGIGYVATGLINGDLPGEAVTGAYASAVSATSPVGSYPVNGSFASPAGYQVQVQDGALTVTPATLTYVADMKSRVAGAPNPPLTGMVSGLVNGENLATATTGTAAFSTTADAATPPGSYAIDGSGLSAGNYVFRQARSNATALRIEAPKPPAPIIPATPLAPFMPPEPTIPAVPGQVPAAPAWQAREIALAAALASSMPDAAAGVSANAVGNGAHASQAVCSRLDMPTPHSGEAGGNDVLAREWARVRGGMSLNSCAGVSRRFDCAGF